MDDEEEILETDKEMMNIIGYEVDTARNGEEALELFKKSIADKNPYDIIILDLTIKGGMGGKQTMKKLLEMDENVLAIVASGYSDDDVMANYRDYGFCARLEKPYNIEKLSHALKSLSNDE